MLYFPAGYPKIISLSTQQFLSLKISVLKKINEGIMNEKLIKIPKVNFFRIYVKDNTDAISPGLNNGKYLAKN